MGGRAPVGRTDTDKARMVHIHFDAKMHPYIRLLVSAEDTSLQDWVSRTVGAVVVTRLAQSLDSREDV